jgi:hypothetical protein
MWAADMFTSPMWAIHALRSPSEEQHTWKAKILSLAPKRPALYATVTRMERSLIYLDQCSIVAGAVWIEQAGRKVFAMLKAGVDGIDPIHDAGLGSEMDEFDGDGRLSTARWEYWKSKYREYAQQDKFSESARWHAERAVQLMDAIESTEVDRMGKL